MSETRWTLPMTLPPVVTVLALVVLPLLLPNRVVLSEETLAARAQVAAAIESAPFLVQGRFTGRTVDIPPSAIELLQPNAILSRSYRDLESGRSYTFLIVHSTDIRDTVGHYPPICYPSAGWSPVGESDVAVEVGDHLLDLRLYRFERMDASGIRRGIHVLNGFVLPDGSSTPEMDELRRRAEKRALAALGVAQVQLVGDASYGPAVMAEAAARLLEGLPEVLASLGLGAPDPTGEEDDDRVRREEDENGGA